MNAKTFNPLDLPIDVKSIRFAKSGEDIKDREIFPLKELPERVLLEHKIETYATSYSLKSEDRASFYTAYRTKWTRDLKDNRLTPTEVYVLDSLLDGLYPFNWLVLHPSNADRLSVSTKIYSTAITKFKKLFLLAPMQKATPRQMAALARLYTTTTSNPWIPTSKFYRLSVNLCWMGSIKYLYDYPEYIDISKRSQSKAEEALIHYPSILNPETALKSMINKRYVSDLFKACGINYEVMTEEFN